jgi:hypothetical protein
VVKDATLAGIVLPGDVDACLLVQPPVGQSEVVRDVPGFLDYYTVGDERCINVAGNARGVVGQGHGGTADDEYVRNDTPTLQPLAEGRKSAFHLGPAEKNIIGFGHAASRS